MYQTTEIASKAGIHPNTVRIYEEWGYISPVPRASNGYRIYSDLHLFQLQVARVAFRCEIVQGQIREKARAVVEANGREDFKTALKLAEDYLAHLEKEQLRALEAIELVEKWLGGKDILISTRNYTRNEAAQLLEVSSEIIRNWERNGLLTVPRLPNGYRRYTEREINRMKIIRSLRQAHYSMSAILRLLNTAEESKDLNVKQVLDTPSECEDIVTVTDRLIHSLEEAIQSARELLRLLNQAVR
ncbi:HTH-type transcriptional regulator ZntR [compost metagenome]